MPMMNKYMILGRSYVMRPMLAEATLERDLPASAVAAYREKTVNHGASLASRLTALVSRWIGGRTA
jgi:hypothetical protein